MAKQKELQFQQVEQLQQRNAIAARQQQQHQMMGRCISLQVHVWWRHLKCSQILCLKSIPVGSLYINIL